MGAEMRKLSAAGILLATFTVSGVSRAGTVLGVEGISSFYKYSDVQNTIGYKLSAGYRLDDLPLFAGFSYINTGFHEIDNSGGGAIGFSGVNLSAGFALPLNLIPDQTVSAWIKAGYYLGDAKGRKPGAASDITDESNGFSYGAGLDWMTKSWLGFRVGFEQLVKVKDFQSGPDSESTMSLFSIGILFADPGHASAYAAPGPAVSLPAATEPAEPTAPPPPPPPTP